MKKQILWIVVDVAAAALILFGVWGINYLIPQKGIHAVPMQNSFKKVRISHAGRNDTHRNVRKPKR